VLVEDGQNTLTKIAGAVRRRGFHIRGLSIGPTREPGRSRITLEVEDLTGDQVHNRELVVAKVKTLELARLIQRGAKVISTDTDGTTVEFSGDRDEIFDFVEELARHGIVDVVRSGPLVMRRTV